MASLRDTLIAQGTQLAGNAAAESVRNRKPKEEPRPPDPDRPALRAAEELIAKHNQREAAEAAAAASTSTELPADLFHGIEGREEEKQLLERALRSQQPVHVLLVGEPGCGKSELLQRIAGLPNSRYAVGGATSSSGLIDYLLEKPNTRNLVIDELDKADQKDLYALYSLMEGGTVTRLQHGAQQHEKRTVWVFAAVNSTEQLPAPLFDRFVTRQVPNYSQEEAREIMVSVLQHREKLSPARAREIADAVSPLSRNPRDGIQVARLAGARGPIDQVVDQVIKGHVSA